MRRSNLSLVVAAVAAVLSLAGVSRADSVTATLEGLDPFTGTTLYVDGTAIGGGGVGLLEWNGALAYGNPYSGNPTSPINYDGLFNTFCIDLSANGFISFGNTYTFATSPLSTTTPIAGTLNDISSAQLNALEGLFGTYLSQITDTDGLEGFQLAVWSILYNYGGTSVATPNNGFYIDPTSTGGFSSTVSSTAIADANFWLANPGNTFDDNLTAMIAVGQGQNQVISGGNFFVTTGAPAPSAAMGGAVLLAGLALARLGRRMAAI
jgi:hypothetical protein